MDIFLEEDNDIYPFSIDSAISGPAAELGQDPSTSKVIILHDVLLDVLNHGLWCNFFHADPDFVDMKNYKKKTPGVNKRGSRK